MTLGKIFYQLLYRPIGAVKRSIREGGPIEQWKTERGSRSMELAAAKLGIGGREQLSFENALGQLLGRAHICK